MSLLDLSYTKLNAPLVTLGNGTAQDILDAISVVELNTTEKSVLSAIKYLIDKNETAYCSAEMIGEHLGKKVSTIRHNLKNLKDKKVFREEFCTVNKKLKRRSSLFVFDMTNQSDSISPIQNPQTDLISTKTYLKSDMRYEVNSDYGLADNTICRLLFGLLEFSHKKITVEEIANVFIEQEFIRVKVLSRSGTRIAMVKDLKYYLALLKICEEQMKVRIESEEAGMLDSRDVKSTIFNVYESDMLFTMDIGKGSAERKSMYNSLYRLEDTEYRLLNLPQTLAEHFSVDEYNGTIRHFAINEYLKTKDDRVIYVFELGQRMTDFLYKSAKHKQNNFIKTHNLLFKVNNSFEFAFLLALSDIPAGKIHRLSWQQLHDKISPRLTRTEFKLKISELLKKYDSEKGSYQENQKGIVHEALSKLNNIQIIYRFEDDFIIQKFEDKELKELLLKEDKKPYRRRIPVKEKN